MNLNSGLFYLRSNQRTIALLDRIALRLSKEKVGNGGAPAPLLRNLQRMGLLPPSSLPPPFFLPYFPLNVWDGITRLLVEPSVSVKHPLASTSAEFVIRGAHLWRLGVRAGQ